MLKFNPKQRFSPEQCLEDEWFKKYAFSKADSNEEETAISSNAIKNMKLFKVDCLLRLDVSLSRLQSHLLSISVSRKMKRLSYSNCFKNGILTATEF